MSSESGSEGVRLTAALERHEARQTNAAAPTGFDAERIRAALRYHGMASLTASRLATIARTSGSGDDTGALAEALGTTVRFEPIESGPRHPIMLVGPPGAGKTVTTAKLAARAMLDGSELHLVSCDTQRACGVEQLQVYVGDYQIEGVATIRFLIEDGKLMSQELPAGEKSFAHHVEGHQFKVSRFVVTFRIQDNQAVQFEAKMGNKIKP